MTWQLDPTHSAATFSVKHMMVSNVKGGFDRFSVEADVDEANLANSRAIVKLDVSSINTGTADRDGHLRSADFFDAEKFPEIVFTTKQITANGGGEAKIRGDLTIRGVTREVELEGEVGGPVKDPWGNDRVVINAEGKVDRRDFGLDFNVPLGGTAVLVGNQVKLAFDAQLVRAN